jgi:SMI1 / KNR4 family (SUKH-1)
MVGDDGLVKPIPRSATEGYVTSDVLRTLFSGRTFGAPCTEADIMRAEEALGEPLPLALRELYTEFDGFCGPTDATFLWPLFAEEGLVSMNQFFRGIHCSRKSWSTDACSSGITGVAHSGASIAISPVRSSGGARRGARSTRSQAPVWLPCGMLRNRCMTASGRKRSRTRRDIRLADSFPTAHLPWRWAGGSGRGWSGDFDDLPIV